MINKEHIHHTEKITLCNNDMYNGIGTHELSYASTMHMKVKLLFKFISLISLIIFVLSFFAHQGNGNYKADIVYNPVSNLTKYQQKFSERSDLVRLVGRWLFEWHARFKCGRYSIKDDSPSGRPST